MLVVFPFIFVEDTKIIYGYNFVAPLSIFARRYILDFWQDSEYASVL